MFLVCNTGKFPLAFIEDITQNYKAYPLGSPGCNTLDLSSSCGGLVITCDLMYLPGHSPWDGPGTKTSNFVGLTFDAKETSDKLQRLRRGRNNQSGIMATVGLLAKQGRA
jgi:hypothetical protein